MKKLLVLLWIVGVFAVLGRAEDDEMEMEYDEDGCPLGCAEDAEEMDVCCEEKTCRDLGGKLKACVTQEIYDALKDHVIRKNN